MINQQKSYIRLLHAVPNAQAIDVYANNKKIASNLAYKQFTDYLAIVPGKYNLRVFPAGKTDKPIIQVDATVPEQSIYTIAAIGKAPTLELAAIPEQKQQIPEGATFLRFAHLSPDAPNVDVRLQDGTTLFKNIGYKEMAKYLQVNPGQYTFELYPTGTNERVLYVPNITLKKNKFYTIYAVGLLNSKKAPLQLLFPLDGISYL